MPREVITGETCLSCGACCIAPGVQPMFCDVTPEDEKRLSKGRPGKKFVRLNVWHPSLLEQMTCRASDGGPLPHGALFTAPLRAKVGPFKGEEFNACVALQGSVLSAVRCSVYKDRPETCRTAMTPGDRNCRRLRRALKLDAKGTRT